MASGGQKGKPTSKELQEGKITQKGSKKKSRVITTAESTEPGATRVHVVDTAEPEISVFERSPEGGGETKRRDSSKQRSSVFGRFFKSSSSSSKESTPEKTTGGFFKAISPGKQGEHGSRKLDLDYPVQATRVSPSASGQSVRSPVKQPDNDIVEEGQGKVQDRSPKQRTNVFKKYFKSGSSSSKDSTPEKLLTSPYYAASPGKKGASPGKTGASPGKTGASPGKTGAIPGKTGASPGKTGASPGKTGASPGKTGASPGKRGASPGKKGDPGGMKAAAGGSIKFSPEQGPFARAASSVACGSGPFSPRRESKSSLATRGAGTIRPLIHVIMEADEHSVSSKDSAPDDDDDTAKATETSPPYLPPPRLQKMRVSPVKHCPPYGLRGSRSPTKSTRGRSQDLSAFDMPLISPNIPENMADTTEYDRPRSSSGSAALKSLISSKSKSRNKSVEREDKKEKDKDKKKGFFEQFRPRSKSDVSGLKRPSKKSSSLPTEHSMDESSLIAQPNYKSFGGSQEIITPMGQILEGQMLNVPEEDRIRHKSGPSGYREGGFLSKIRTRSNSETKPPKSPKRPLQSQKSLSPPSSPRADRSVLSPLKFQSGEPRSAPPGVHRGSVFSDHTNASRVDGQHRLGADSGDRMETEDVEYSEDQVYSKFMRRYKCYDLIPTSAKLVIFDTQLKVKKAFFALIYNGVRAAPLWDTEKQDYVGMLTITDFIYILKRFYKTKDARMDELEDHKIKDWREMEKDRGRPFMCISPEASLYDAVKSLSLKHVHRLPVVEEATGNALYILTHKRILRFLHLFVKEINKPPFMYSSIKDLNIGTFRGVITATPDTKIIDALNLFIEHRISALPVINDSGEVINIYARFDVINLAADKSYTDLDITIEQALKNRQGSEETELVATCLLSETLCSVVEKIVRAEVHRLVIVDEENHVKGIISLSDILRYIVLRPMGDLDEAAEQAPLEDQPPLAEEPAIIEAPLLEPELMGTEMPDASS